MPEEARLLVDRGVAYIVDDTQNHEQGMAQLANQDRKAYLEDLERQGRQASSAQAERKEQHRQIAMEKQKAKCAKKSVASNDVEDDGVADAGATSQQPADDLLFAPGSAEPSAIAAATTSPSIPRQSEPVEPALRVTPATSENLIRNQSPPPQDSPSAIIPRVPPSYELFAHLHSKGYFLSPGLRFGCQYLAYPGDPLRFHSHFLGVAYDWDEEIDLMDLVVGGRLGTGVKKGFLIGGAEKPAVQEPGDGVRVFSLEWAGM
ncbi:tRNA-splicing endonuclease subunit [Ascosphaera atra]|nr:tRNA-splicing endonuclease subunit [Ascosphaera atra]